MANGKEIWIARCPKCGEANLTLAPANGFTKHAPMMVEVYCTNCQWQGKLADNMKHIYVRM